MKYGSTNRVREGSGLRRDSKLQSAMEYLMTYGWAILVIAVVLGVLYSLGIFSPSSFAPKAQPGSCQVFRPNGPGTSYDLNLEGTCTGQVPQYVASMSGCSGCGNVNGSRVLISAPNFPTSMDNFTIFAWLNPTSGQCSEPVFGSVRDTYGTANAGAMLSLVNGAPALQVSGYSYRFYGTTAMTLNSWSQVAATYSLGNVAIYVNGKQTDSGNIGVSPATFDAAMPNLAVGYDNQTIWCSGTMSHLTGQISNVQFYNASLSANEVGALYAEGIGGAPVKLQSLLGWWPLNGNANDYSGNNNDGVASNTTFIGNIQT